MLALLLTVKTSCALRSNHQVWFRFLLRFQKIAGRSLIITYNYPRDVDLILLYTTITEPTTSAKRLARAGGAVI